MVNVKMVNVKLSQKKSVGVSDFFSLSNARNKLNTITYYYSMTKLNIYHLYICYCLYLFYGQRNVMNRCSIDFSFIFF